MEFHTLQQLADKYWQGECTDQEEQDLTQALLNQEVPAGLEALADYLRFNQAERNSLTLDDSFDEMILQQIQPTIQKPQKLRSSRASTFFQIAAAIALLMVSSFSVYSLMQPVTPAETEWVDTYDNSEEAYREVRKALMLVSSTMNDGMEHTQALGEFHKATLETRN